MRELTHMLRIKTLKREFHGATEAERDCLFILIRLLLCNTELVHFLVVELLCFFVLFFVVFVIESLLRNGIVKFCDYHGSIDVLNV